MDWSYFSLLFFFISFLIVFSIFLVITIKNFIHLTMLFWVLVLLEIIFIIIFLNVQFLPLIFIIIYVGTVAILFLFVVMMIDVKIIKSPTNYFKYFYISGITLLNIFFFLIFIIKESIFLNQLSNELIFSSNYNNFINTLNNFKIFVYANILLVKFFCFFLFVIIVNPVIGVLLLFTLTLIVFLIVNIYIIELLNQFIPLLQIIYEIIKKLGPYL
jgi:NADH:ubiquinone oxidoreductase subunit 6 (subunit J)